MTKKKNVLVPTQAHPGSQQSCLLRLEARGLQAARNVPLLPLLFTPWTLSPPSIAKVHGRGDAFSSHSSSLHILWRACSLHHYQTDKYRRIAWHILGLLIRYGPGPINLIRHLSRLQVTLVLQGESWEMAATVNQTRAFNLSFYSSDASSRTGQHCWVEQIRPRQCQATCGAGPAIEGALHLLFPPGYAAILCAALGDAPALSWVRKMGRIQCQNITFFFYLLHDFMLTNQSPKTFPSHLSSPRWPPCRPAQAKSATVLESLLQTGAEWEPPQTSLEW